MKKPHHNSQNFAKILIVDDEPTARYGLRRALHQPYYLIEEAENGRQALDLTPKFLPDVIVCDINMPEMNGFEFLKNLELLDLASFPRPLVIVITAYGSEKIAVEAIKAGAYDYLSKPYDLDELRLTIKKAMEKQQLGRENLMLRQQLGQIPEHEILGQSEAILNILKLIEKVAPTDVSVLITGDSGTGKELVAKTIHAFSARSSRPFITMNCAAIPKDLVESELFGHEKGAFTGAILQRQGKFEIANTGTLFLDEIADMSLETQSKILRILEDKTFMRLGGKDLIHTDVRLLSATNKDLSAEIAQGRFRSDLYYRIKVVQMLLPRLAERKSDIPILTEKFLQHFSRRHRKDVQRIDPQVLKIFMAYDWPGNVRQLKHVIEQGVVLSDGNALTAQHLPAEMVAGKSEFTINFGEMPLTEAKERVVRTFEKTWIEQALRETHGNVSRAARLLQIKRQFLQQKMQILGIEAKHFRN